MLPRTCPPEQPPRLVRLTISQEVNLFSPFDNQLESLSAPDLERLRDVAEGWYIEYKSEVSKAPDIAKSISALANTYGGWIFYGC